MAHPLILAVLLAFSEDEGVCIELPERLIDWRVVAREQLGADAVKPSRAFLKRHPPEYGDSVARFEAAAPASLGSERWLVLHAKGVAPLRLYRLRGVMQMDVSDDLALNGPPVFAGRACGRTDKPVKAAFVIRGRSARLLGERPVEERFIEAPIADHQLFIRWRDKEYVFEHDNSIQSVEKVLLFEIEKAGDHMLVVWNSQADAACEASYSLFRLKNGVATKVGDNHYGCDV